MRLMSVTLEGYKRFAEETEIDVAGDVIALVGPNEAGKSTILEALLSFDRESAFTDRERTRDDKGETSVELGYVLDDDDRASLADIPGGDKVRWWTCEKAEKDGNFIRYISLHPSPQRDLSPRRTAVGLLKTFAEEEQLAARFHQVNNLLVPDLYQGAVDALSSEAEDLSPQQEQAIHSFAQTMLKFPGICAEPTAGSTDQHLTPEFCALLKSLEVYKEDLAPRRVAWNRLLERRPKCLMFTAADRDLRTDYPLPDVIGSVPLALANLARLAQLDLHQLLGAVERGNSGRRETLLERANDQLRQVFKESWGQSPMTVRLALRGPVLEVLVSIPGGGYNEIAERSAGLQAFVALRAFMALHETEVPPILLVDEAEMHLHYDAQAELVNLFTEQRLTAKVIYTTHSAGCLPRDLGNGIRVVEPIPESERSRIQNSVWGGREAGFTPLVFGMGATTFAFLPARFVVIGEGPSDAMLYPTLFREANGQKDLKFQVAPGLATASPSQMPDLTSQGGQVLFIADGDDDGKRYQENLEQQGVPCEHIFRLDLIFGESLQLEDLIDPSIYASAVNDIVNDFQKEEVKLQAKDIPSANRLAKVDSWCKSHGVKAPCRVDIAQRLLDLKSESVRKGADLRLVQYSRIDTLRQVHERIMEIFNAR